MTADPLFFRDATRDDLAQIVELILADSLSNQWESGADGSGPNQALSAIESDPNNRLVVVERSGTLLGTMQLTFIPQLTLRGGLILQIENVRVDASARSGGVGREMIEWAIEEARGRGCALVQLMSNAERVRAHSFYERMGFKQSHAGFKYSL